MLRFSYIYIYIYIYIIGYPEDTISHIIYPDDISKHKLKHLTLANHSTMNNISY